jgi:hypothetical protein
LADLDIAVLERIFTEAVVGAVSAYDSKPPIPVAPCRLPAEGAIKAFLARAAAASSADFPGFGRTRNYDPRR